MELAQPIGVDPVAFGFRLGQDLDGRRVSQMGLQSHFLQQIGDPRPAVGRLQSHGRALGHARQPLPHGRAILVFQASSLNDLDLAFRGHLF